MSERPTLSLRPKLTLGGAKPAQPAARVWKCKPCGAPVEVPEGLDPAEVIRCANCNAKLGKAADFYAPTETFARLRARPAADKPAAPAVPKVLVSRSARKKTVWVK